MTKKIIFIRHGKASMEGSDSERKLDDDGISQALSLKEKLNSLGFKSAKIYSSPFSRALETIEPFINQSKEFEIVKSKELEEIHIPKNPNLSKHQIIEKMWSDENYKVDDGISQKQHFEKIRSYLDNLFQEFKTGDKDLIFVTHGNLIGIILKFYFKISFGFQEWKKMTMPDIYLLKFDKENKFVNMERDNKNIDKIFTI